MNSINHKKQPAENNSLYKDPVCGMEVDPSSATKSMDYHDKTYYFCSESCHDKFHQNPE